MKLHFRRTLDVEGDLFSEEDVDLSQHLSIYSPPILPDGLGSVETDVISKIVASLFFAKGVQLSRLNV